MNIVVFTLALLAVYMVALKAVSYFAYKISSNNTEDYFLAKRSTGLLALVGTTGASVFSTGTVVSGPSEFFTKGTDYFWWASFFILIPLAMLPLIGNFWTIGKAKGYITPGQMLGDFYQSRSLQALVAFIGLLAMIPYATAQMVAVGKTFEALTGGVISYEVGISIICVAIGLYLWFGGSRAVIWTDMIQGILFAGLLIVSAGLVLNWAGGWVPVMSNLNDNHPDKASFDVGLHYFEMIPIMMSLFFLPYVWQRAYMAKSAVDVVKTMAVLSVVCFFLIFAVWIIGTSALRLFPDGLADGDNVLGAVFRDHAPYFGAVVLVAAFAAGMSTVDSQLLSAGSLMTHDIKRPLLRRRLVARLGWRENYKFARVMTLVLLAGIYVWSLTLQSTLVMTLIILGMSLTVVMAPAVLGIFYWKRASAAAAFWSIALGLAVFLIKGLTPLGVYFPTAMLPSSWALIVATVVFVVLSLVTDSEKLAESRAEYDAILKG